MNEEKWLNSTTSLILDDGPHGLNGTHEGKREIRITNINVSNIHEGHVC